MSDYDILPKNLPDTTSEMADLFEMELPETYLGSPLKMIIHSLLMISMNFSSTIHRILLISQQAA